MRVVDIELASDVDVRLTREKSCMQELVTRTVSHVVG